MHFAGGRRVVQSVAPSFAYKKIPIPTQGIRDAERIEGRGVVRVRFQVRLGEGDRLLDFILKTLFNFRRGIYLRTAKEGIVSRNELTFQRPDFKHFTELDALSEVVVQIGRVRVFGDDTFELVDSLIIFQIIKMVKRGI